MEVISPDSSYAQTGKKNWCQTKEKNPETESPAFCTLTRKGNTSQIEN